MIDSCLEPVKTHADIAFDLVLGPRSRATWSEKHDLLAGRGKVRLHQETSQLPRLHASADLVISTGGYNSVLETLQGSARILCAPYRTSRRDEPHRHIARLRKFVDIDVSASLTGLPMLFQRAIHEIGRDRARDRRDELDFHGASTIEKILRDDLGMGA